MEKEFGMWVLDVAKYIATTTVLSSVFGSVDTWIMYVSATLNVIFSLYIGYPL